MPKKKRVKNGANNTTQHNQTRAFQQMKVNSRQWDAENSM
jgi:hypothetical protein